MLVSESVLTWRNRFVVLFGTVSQPCLITVLLLVKRRDVKFASEASWEIIHWKPEWEWKNAVSPAVSPAVGPVYSEGHLIESTSKSHNGPKEPLDAHLKNGGDVAFLKRTLGWQHRVCVHRAISQCGLGLSAPCHPMPLRAFPEQLVPFHGS